MFKAMLNGWLPPKNLLSYTRYHHIKQNKDEDLPLTGFTGVCCSFGGKWFSCYAKSHRKTGATRCGEGYRNLVKQLPNLKGIEFYSGDYRDLEMPNNSIIYCDPPYVNKSKRAYKDKFNHKEFFNWCIKMATNGHKVFVSEYEINHSCFVEVWRKEIITTLKHDCNSSPRTEKLYKVEGF